MSNTELRARLAAKAQHYAEAAQAAGDNAVKAAAAGSASEVARLNGMREALEQAARDFTVLSEEA